MQTKIRKSSLPFSLQPTKWLCAQQRLRSAWLSTQSDQSLGSLATHWAHSEDSDQTGWMPRLIWVFAGHTVTFLVLSCCGSYGMSRFCYSWCSWRYNFILVGFTYPTEKWVWYRAVNGVLQSAVLPGEKILPPRQENINHVPLVSMTLGIQNYKYLS